VSLHAVPNEPHAIQVPN